MTFPIADVKAKFSDKYQLPSKDHKGVYIPDTDPKKLVVWYLFINWNRAYSINEIIYNITKKEIFDSLIYKLFPVYVIYPIDVNDKYLKTPDGNELNEKKILDAIDELVKKKIVVTFTHNSTEYVIALSTYLYQ